jgi:hypothetical protein
MGFGLPILRRSPNGKFFPKTGNLFPRRNIRHRPTKRDGKASLVHQKKPRSTTASTLALLQCNNFACFLGSDTPIQRADQELGDHLREMIDKRDI